MDRFAPPTKADDLQTCAGCFAKVLPEGLDKNGFCYADCSPYDSEDDERKDEKDE